MADYWKGTDDINYINYFISAFSIIHWLNFFAVSWNSFLYTFYILMLLIFLVFIDFLYVSFAVSNQKHSFAFTWPINLLQYVCILLITVMF